MFLIIGKKWLRVTSWRNINRRPIVKNSEAGYLDEVSKAAGGEGYDIVIENASHINLAADLNVIAPKARVVVRKSHLLVLQFFISNFSQIVGNKGDIAISPRILMTKEASLIGCALFRSTPVNSTKIHYSYTDRSKSHIYRTSGRRRAPPLWPVWMRGSWRQLLTKSIQWKLFKRHTRKFWIIKGELAVKLCYP